MPGTVKTASMKALVISTFPTRKAVHGGQLRAQALTTAYAATYGTVRIVAVYNFEMYSPDEISTDDIRLSADAVREIHRYPFLEQFVTAEAILNDPTVRMKFLSLLKEYRPDVLIYEQPYLYNSVSALVAETDLNPLVVYSSYNHESELLRSIVESLDLDEQVQSVAQGKLDQLIELEQRIAQQADGVIAVSAAEAAELRAFGASNVLVVPNAMDPVVTPKRVKKSYHTLFQTQLAGPFALFVGSDHLPNVTGFVEMIGYRLGYLPPETKIVVAGGAGPAILRHIEKLNDQYSGFLLGRLVLLGRVSDELLALLLARASCVILPLTGGAGSNLKTAEALLSGKPIVSTRFAFRGFEAYESLERVSLCDNVDEFRATVVDRLNQSITQPVQRSKKLTEAVTWTEALKPLTAWLIDISKTVPQLGGTRGRAASS